MASKWKVWDSKHIYGNYPAKDAKTAFDKCMDRVSDYFDFTDGNVKVARAGHADDYVTFEVER